MKVAPASYHNHGHDILRVLKILAPLYQRLANRLKTDDVREIGH